MAKSLFKVGKAQPAAWLSIKKPVGKKLPTRTIIKKHLKEWNFDELDELKQGQKEDWKELEKEKDDLTEEYYDKKIDNLTKKHKTQLTKLRKKVND